MSEAIKLFYLLTLLFKPVLFNCFIKDKKNSVLPGKNNNILAIHLDLKYRIPFWSRNNLENTEMKTNRCSLQERNQPQANQQGEPEQDGEEMHGIEFSSGQCLPVRLLRRPAVIKNCFSWQNYKTPTVFSKDGVDPSWILKLPFAEASKWENTWLDRKSVV